MATQSQKSGARLFKQARLFQIKPLQTNTIAFPIPAAIMWLISLA